MDLCPLLANDTEGSEESVVQVFPLQMTEETAPGVDTATLGAILATVKSTLVTPQAMAKAMPREVVQSLPTWAQAVVHTGCFSEGSAVKCDSTLLGSPTRRKRSPHTSEESTPSKRRRRRRVDDTDDEDDEEMEMDAPAPASQEAGDELAPRTLFTPQDRAAKSIDKYSEAFQSLVETAQERQQEQEEAGWDDARDVLTMQEINGLVQSLKVMEKHNLIEKCDETLLLALMTVLDQQVQIGQRLNILGVEDANKNNKMQPDAMDSTTVMRLHASMDAAICELVVMATPGIDRQLLSDEWIENAIQFLVHAVDNNLLLCIDTTLAAARLPHARLQRKRTRASSDPTMDRAQPPVVLLNFKTNKTVQAAMERLVPVACEFMQHFAKLLLAVSLADRWILQSSSKMASLFLLERNVYATLLQRSGVLVLRAIFVKYRPHRALVLEEVLSVLLKLPTSKRNLRTFKLVGSSQHVQMITTLVVTLIQACAGLTKTISDVESAPQQIDEESQGKQRKNAAEAVIDDAQEVSRHFIGQLLKECMKRTEERDNRAILENFTEDLLMMFARPEWAGTEILLEVLSSSLAAVLHSNLSNDSRKLESQFSLLAVHLVGRICAAMKTNETAMRQNVFEDDASQSVLQEHECYLREIMSDDPALVDDMLPTRSVILKHVVLTYMRQHKGDTTQLDAIRMLLSRFILQGQTNDVDTSTNHTVWSLYWDPNPGRVDPSSKLALLSHDICLRASLHVTCSGLFCGQFDQLLVHLMALLPKGIVAFRSRVMKALSAIIDVDPMLMSQPSVQKAVSFCFLDEAISVRQATVDLVGKYITMQPALFDQYFDSLTERLRDKGISVRKSVCKIFRGYLSLQTAGSNEIQSMELADHFRRRARCMRKLVERIGDITEDVSVKDYIVETFREAWFGDTSETRRLWRLQQSQADQTELPPGWTQIERTGNERKTVKSKNLSIGFKSPDGKLAGSTEEAWALYRAPQITPVTMVKSKSVKLDDVTDTVTTILEVIGDMQSTDWFVTMLKQILGEVPSNSSAYASSTRGRIERIVAFLVESVLRLDEGEPIDGLSFNDSEAQFLACMKILDAISKANSLLVASHLEVVMVYLKGEERMSKSSEAKLQSLVVSIIGNIVMHTERLTERVASTLEDDFRNLICHGPPSVVKPSVRCLAILSTHARRAPTLLFKLLEMFYKYLRNYKNKQNLDDISPAESAVLQRALYVSGLIAGSIDLDQFDVPENSVLVQGKIMDNLYEVYSVFLSRNGSPACVAKAMQGLGFLYLTGPRYLLQTQTDEFLDALLTSPSNEVKLQCVLSLRELLEHEERRLEDGAAMKRMNSRKTKQEQVQGDQEGEAAVIGSVMQAQLEHLIDLLQSKSTRLRSEALACVAVLLTQGLVSPLHCIPALVSLETDQVVSIRDIAHAQLVALHEKFPSTLQTPSVDGVALSYSFQLKLFDKCSIFALDKDKKDYCLLGRLYSSCIRPSRQQRNIWLNSLVNHFSGKGNVLSVTNIQSLPLKTLEYLCYLSQLLTALPFDIEDEPLFIIYVINRFVTLKLGPIMQELRQDFADFGIAPEMLEDEDADLSQIDIDDYIGNDADYDYDQLKDQLRRCSRACAIGLLIRIKFYLKDMYVLDNEKCQTYRPDSLIHTTDQALMIATRTPTLLLPSEEELHPSRPLELNWNLFMFLWKAASDDQQQLDYEADAGYTQPRKRRARRKKVVVRPPIEDEDEDDDDDAVEIEDMDELSDD